MPYGQTTAQIDQKISQNKQKFIVIKFLKDPGLIKKKFNITKFQSNINEILIIMLEVLR